MVVVGLVLFILGIIFVIVAPINKKKNARCSMQTQGTLKEKWEGDSSDGGGVDTYLYSYYVDGIEYQTKSSICSPEANSIGDSCTIWYNPAKPKEAQPFHSDSDKGYKILIIIGIVMIPLGIILSFLGIVL